MVERLLASRAAVLVMSSVPVPLPMLRRILQRDNARENRKDSWQRLRDDAERARYEAVRAMVERYARDGFVLDIGCSQGILAEGLHYRRYLGIDSFAESVRIASAKTDPRTTFVCADAMTFVPDRPADAVVFNEVLYYLPDPLGAVRHHARSLSRDGVVVVSVFAHAWSTRRLLRQIAAELKPVEVEQVRSGHLAWTVIAYRPRTSDHGEDEHCNVSDDPVVEFLRHAVLVYDPDDGPERRQQALDVLATRPALAQDDPYVAAALADPDALAHHLAVDPEVAQREGGPFGWPPLLYLSYSRVWVEPDGDRAEQALRLLLDAGAEPNSGFLWQGDVPPFTALTGLFGNGEQGSVNQPPHPYAVRLARLLLEAGADPNDGQTLYNRMFSTADDHLELLFAYGLGQGDGGPWRQRLGDRQDTPAEMLQAQLVRAVTHGLDRRVRLLAEHGVDLSTPIDSRWLPIAPGPGGRAPSPRELAIQSGQAGTARLLAELGASTGPPDPETALLGALLAADVDAVGRLRELDPDIVDRVRERRPSLVLRAAVLRRLDAVRLLVQLGFDVNARGRIDVPVEQEWETALHHAAGGGDVELTQLLLSLGADPSVLDKRFSATPLGWARNFDQTGTIAVLETISPA